MLHRFFLPPVHTLFHAAPALVAGDIFVGVPLFLAIHAGLALELPAAAAAARAALRALAPDDDGEDRDRLLPPDDKHMA